ncbi:MAG TPA: quinate 5-dehydrogenase [Desulfobacteria bacterium]|nr:quinate 5-dehydrogenase [Desulfobacteria bacterium]
MSIQCLKVYGVSLGSSKRDYSAQLHLAGADISIKRLGCDGDLNKALQLVRRLDGKVDAIGLGGVNFQYRLGKRSYRLREGSLLAAAAGKTPVVDGTFIKQYWEPEVVNWLYREKHVDFAAKHVLLTSALDRYELGVCLERLGARVMVGDALLALKIPVLFHGVSVFRAAALPTMPLLSRLPLRCLYPLGRKQEQRKAGWDRLLTKIDYIVGDFHLINRHLPQNLTGKKLLMSSLTKDDRLELTRRGAVAVYALGITAGERSFGANIMDGIIAAAARKETFGTPNKKLILQILKPELLALKGAISFDTGKTRE